MPALNIPAGYVEGAFVMQQNDTLKPAICTIGFHSVVLSELEAIGDLWRDDMLAEMNNGFTYKQARFRTGVGLLYAKNYNSPGAGGGSGTSPQVTYLFKKLTGEPGRLNQGRFYYPGCDETSVDADGRVSSGKLTGLQTMVDGFWSDVDGLGVDQVLFHTAVPALPTAIFGYNAETVVATQRRRLRRGL